MSTTDLLGDEMPAPLPAGKRLRRFDDLIGHTILAAFIPSENKCKAGVVIVTETKCWITIDAESDGDGAHIETGLYSDPRTLSDFVGAQDLFDSGCINHGEYELLKKAEDEKEHIKREREKNLLLRRLAELEQAPKAGSTA